MKRPLTQKFTPSQIRERFDSDVARFENLESGQAATIDAPLAMELITQAAVSATPKIHDLLDIGCGAGNNTIKLLRAAKSPANCDLCDLSAAMLDAATRRVSAETSGRVRSFEGDFRDIRFEPATYDVILAAAVFHHLRDDADWEAVFAKVFSILKPGGSIWISDLVIHESEPIDSMMWARYHDYLTASGGTDYANHVFDYIDLEDSPRPVTYQIDLLRKVGFHSVDILHKNSCFAAFGAVKAGH